VTVQGKDCGVLQHSIVAGGCKGIAGKVSSQLLRQEKSGMPGQVKRTRTPFFSTVVPQNGDMMRFLCRYLRKTRAVEADD
jgi:hypothetical protein